MDKMQSIYNSAVKLIAKKGYESTTINEIVKDANISVGSFYNYFKSKEELLRCILMYNESVNIIHLNAVRRMNISSVNKIRLHLDYIIAFSVVKPDTSKIIVANIIKIQDCDIRDMQLRYYCYIIKFINEGIAENSIKDIESDVIFQVISSTILNILAFNNPIYKKRLAIELMIDSIKVEKM